ncbi:MAG: hypothetical protein ACI8ZM_005392 [Crocinitomix sp.]|jgi:hypothetical protein
MKVTQKLTEVTKLIDGSQIYEALRNLEEELDYYQGSRFNQQYRYAVNQEILAVKKTVSTLENQLKDLIDQSVRRETTKLE